MTKQLRNQLTVVVLFADIVVVDETVGVAATRQAGGTQTAVVLLAGRRMPVHDVQVAIGRVEFVMQSTHQLMSILQFG